MSSALEAKYTSVDVIPKIASSLVHTFATHKTKPVEWRLKQLRKLYWGFKDNEQAVFDALKKDLNKHPVEAYQAELGWVLNDILFASANLEQWVKDEKAPDIPLMFMPVGAKIRKDPLGCVLIIGTYNFPIQLCIGPLIGAIAAGCTALLKPSESAPHSALIMQKIIESSLDPSAYAVVQGAIPETTRLLEQKWDKIFYTGGEAVAKIISKKAAETLTPVTLELGGRNPAIITKNANLHLAARRLLWAKNMNAGQVCVSQNYIIIEESVLSSFLAEFKIAFKEFYPRGAKESPDYGRIINKRTFQRLQTMLNSTKGKILLGGSTDESELFFEPTLVLVTDPEDSLLVDESFGPLIPILAVPDLNTAIRHANNISGTPLGIYPFGNKQETSRVVNETRSGGVTINDGFFHASIPTLAFGGVGSSGQGSYRGRASFDCFTHRRSIVTTPNWMERLIEVRYPPYTAAKMKTVRSMDSKPDFDREGNRTMGLLETITTLGAGRSGSALRRWMTVVFGKSTCLLSCVFMLLASRWRCQSLQHAPKGSSLVLYPADCPFCSLRLASFSVTHLTNHISNISTSQ